VAVRHPVEVQRLECAQRREIPGRIFREQRRRHGNAVLLSHQRVAREQHIVMEKHHTARRVARRGDDGEPCAVEVEVFTAMKDDVHGWRRRHRHHGRHDLAERSVMRRVTVQHLQIAGTEENLRTAEQSSGGVVIGVAVCDQHRLNAVSINSFRLQLRKDGRAFGIEASVHEDCPVYRPHDPRVRATGLDADDARLDLDSWAIRWFPDCDERNETDDWDGNQDGEGKQDLSHCERSEHSAPDRRADGTQCAFPDYIPKVDGVHKLEERSLSKISAAPGTPRWNVLVRLVAAAHDNRTPAH
jgi:hypothetical protein